jgi:hypothetical protein
MESGLRTGEASSAEILSAVSWGSIAAGAVTASAVSLALVALGVGLGLSAVSPWTDTGVSASTFKVTAGVYLVLVAVMSSAIGGYLSARLRTKWVGILKSAASDGPPLFPGGPVTEEGAKEREGTLLRRRTSSRGP